MTPRPAPSIRIPFSERWRDARTRLVPALVFLGAVAAIAILWRDHVSAPTLVGQAEPVQAAVSCQKPGLLAELKVTRFQRVKAGDTIGQVMIAEPRLLEASLAVIRSEIEALRVSLSPILTQQRNAINYTQLQLDWMKERATLASAQVSLQLARIELQRTTELFQAKVVSQQSLDVAAATCGKREQEVEQLSRLLAEMSQYFTTLQLTNCPDLTGVSSRPLESAIAVQEAKLRVAEAELSPITLRASIDGIVTTVFRRSGEAVTAGQPIVTIATLAPVRIVGYMRPPLAKEPQPGMSVLVRARSLGRQVGRAKIIEVGSQFETIPPTLAGPLKPAAVELGLPVDISLPPNLALRPGEMVDITLDSRAD